jgi:hypothetical protein
VAPLDENEINLVHEQDMRLSAAGPPAAGIGTVVRKTTSSRSEARSTGAKPELIAFGEDDKIEDRCSDVI